MGKTKAQVNSLGRTLQQMQDDLIKLIANRNNLDRNIKRQDDKLREQKVTLKSN